MDKGKRGRSGEESALPISYLHVPVHVEDGALDAVALHEFREGLWVVVVVVVVVVVSVGGGEGGGVVTGFVQAVLDAVQGPLACESLCDICYGVLVPLRRAKAKEGTTTTLETDGGGS